MRTPINQKKSSFFSAVSAVRTWWRRSHGRRKFARALTRLRRARGAAPLDAPSRAASNDTPHRLSSSRPSHQRPRARREHGGSAASFTAIDAIKRQRQRKGRRGRAANANANAARRQQRNGRKKKESGNQKIKNRHGANNRARPRIEKKEGKAPHSCRTATVSAEACRRAPRVRASLES